MRLISHRSPIGALWILSSLLVLLSGCSYFGTIPTPVADDPIVEPQLPPDIKSLPQPIAVPAPTAPTTVVVEPDPEPVVTPPDVLRVAVVLSSHMDAYENVANALAAQLETVDIYDLSDKSLTPKEMFDAIRSSNTKIIVAIGVRATAYARSFEEIPVVFSQVFNLGQLDLTTDNVKGVSVLPPLELQIAAWRELNPNLSSIGAIVGKGHERLLEEATASAAAHDVRFQYRTAQSDRETLYLFTRLVPDIDGFWLFPDNRILSATVLRQMLTYAHRHRVQVAVFNDSLLSLGATISTTSVDADIAETIVTVANRLLEEGGIGVPALTPLKQIQIRTNAQSLDRLASDVREISEGAH